MMKEKRARGVSVNATNASETDIVISISNQDTGKLSDLTKSDFVKTLQPTNMTHSSPATPKKK
jgi:hypothetical protein